MAVSFRVLGFLESTDLAVIDQGLHRPPSFLGVNSVQGAGTVLGGLTAALVLRRLGEVRTVGIALAMDAAGALALTHANLPVVLAGFIVMGVAISWLLAGYAPARQRLTPPRLQAGSPRPPTCSSTAPRPPPSPWARCSSTCSTTASCSPSSPAWCWPAAAPTPSGPSRRLATDDPAPANPRRHRTISRRDRTNSPVRSR